MKLVSMSLQGNYISYEYLNKSICTSFREDYPIYPYLFRFITKNLCMMAVRQCAMKVCQSCILMVCQFVLFTISTYYFQRFNCPTDCHQTVKIVLLLNLGISCLFIQTLEHAQYTPISLCTYSYSNYQDRFSQHWPLAQAFSSQKSLDLD